MARNDFIKRLNEVIVEMLKIIEERGNSRDQILVKRWYEVGRETLQNDFARFKRSTDYRQTDTTTTTTTTSGSCCC